MEIRYDVLAPLGKVCALDTPQCIEPIGPRDV